MFGSCRIGAPESLPYTSSSAEHDLGVGVDALWAYARALQQGLVAWPDALVLLGDQVYADEVPPETAAFISSRRDGARGRPGRGCGLRGVHASLPGIVVRPGHSLAALGGAVDDDLRRPRSPRRLEHLRLVDRRNAREDVVARSDHGRVHGLLPLSAPRQSLTARAGGGAPLPGATRRRRRRTTSQGARTGLGRGPRFEPVDVLPRLWPFSTARPRLTRSADRRRGKTADDGSGGVGLDRRARPRNLRSRRARLEPPRLSASGDPSPRGVERGDLRRRVGRTRAAARRAAPTRRRSRALGGLSAFVRSPRGSSPLDLRRPRWPTARVDHHPQWGRAHDVRGGRRPRRSIGQRARAPDRLLAVPQPLEGARAPDCEDDGVTGGRESLLALGASRRRRAHGGLVETRDRPDVRQLDRPARTRRSRRVRHALSDGIPPRPGV